MRTIDRSSRSLSLGAVGVAAALVQGALFPAGEAQAQATCARTITADVVALDQPFFYNRFGTVNPAGMIYALRRDVVDMSSGLTEAEGGVLTAGNVALREDKRPRPIVLRANIGDCLQIDFQNLLAPQRVNDNQPATRAASVHVMGMEYANDIQDDGAFVGENPSSLVEPGDSATYNLLATHEGTRLLFSGGAMTGGEGDGGSLAFGLFGSVNVLKEGAEWYRSQVTHEELELATVGTLPTGHPIIDYDAVYPAGHRFEGLPILALLQGNELVHSDLDAIITGPNRGDFPAGTYPPNPVIAPNAEQPQAPGADTRPREEPFRELTIIFHGEIFAVQSFPEFEDPVLGFTLASVKDGFGINYGVQSAGAAILANRKMVGPAGDCNECYYEEFFLSSWPNGDPAMVVDVPANAADPASGNVATRAFFPADPANVHHAYLGDHTKMRNLHAGPKEHHVFHLHAHQWLFTPDSDQSSYLDSQTIGPGSNYTYDLVYNGGGNRNITPGDAIFHCHFYPHFAQGMWELFRVHDTFEAGTELDEDGRPVAGARAQSDFELTAPDGRKTGSPIPAVVPIPTLAMAPLPGDVEIDPNTGNAVVADASVNPGFPFFIPGNTGHRSPQPALDMIDDGGLERHVVLDGESESVLNRLDFDKVILTLDVMFLPQAGTEVEQTAMAFHEERTHDSVTPEGDPLPFVTNGLPRVAGAPFADPCVDEFGNPQGLENGLPARNYKAAAIDLDIIINKVGWHYPQSRMLALWNDVDPLLNMEKPPEPLFIRANSGECIEYQLTNLQPHTRELDDFQVRAPTADTIGQHIHLVKFDVTSSDGAGNGWNYEDGSFSPEEVRARIDAIRAFHECGPNDVSEDCPVAEEHPFFGGGEFLGAQTVVQRWWADPVVNQTGDDRTLRTVFTHDHFAPASQQHAAHYAGLLVEPAGSVWRDPETGDLLGGGFDGGPTSFQADIIPPDESEAFREFGLAFEDFQLAYEQGAGGDNANPVPDPNGAINPPGRIEIGLPDLLARPDQCPGGVAPPCPEAVSSDDPGTFSVNYRDEPVALRVFDPAAEAQAAGRAGDLSFVFRSDVERAIPELNTALGDTPYPPLTAGIEPGDPFTPLLRAYQGDDIEFRIVVGAHEEAMYSTVSGLKWLFEPAYPDSGWRNTQMMGISEHFEFEIPLTPTVGSLQPFADRFWGMSVSKDGFWNGSWGLLRAYDRLREDLLELPNNEAPGNGRFQEKIANRGDFEATGICPPNAPVRQHNVSAVAASTAVQGGRVVYNPRQGAFAGNPGPLTDPTALLYVLDSDIQDPDARRDRIRLRAGTPLEPLVLRATAGDCIQVRLTNRLPDNLVELDAWSAVPMLIDDFNQNDLAASREVGLRPQLLAVDPTRHQGWNIGLNSVESGEQQQTDQTVAPGETIVYRWYAGDLSLDENNNLVGTPVEFGATNLIPSDPIEHSTRGLVAALIIEPEGSTWVTDQGTRAAATVTKGDGSTFREFVTVFQDDIQMRDANNVAICPVRGGVPCTGAEDPEDSANKALNYRSEPMWFRVGFDPGSDFQATRDEIFTEVLSNGFVGGDPATPVFTAQVGQEVRFRVLEPNGHQRGTTFQVHGHYWQREPYVSGAVPSQFIGDNPLSEVYGAQEGHGPENHFDVLLEEAGGEFEVLGDFLFRDQGSFQFDGGTWGIMRVQP